MTSPFPPVIILIRNTNSFDFAYPYGGTPIEFRRNVWKKVSPEVAHTLFAWDTRTGNLERDDQPNPRDRNTSYFSVCELRYGWANKPECATFLRNFEAKILPIEDEIPGEVGERIRSIQHQTARTGTYAPPKQTVAQ